MKNLSSINHNQFSRLFELTKSYNKATLLDKLIYWWQISTFTIPNDPHIWFTRAREQIAKESKLSLRTVDRYLNEFSQKGLIKKTNRLLIKKHLYIRITDTLLLALGIQNEKEPPIKKEIETVSIKTTPEQTNKDHKDNKDFSFNLAQIGSIEIANSAVPIYKDQDNNLNNNNVKKNHFNVLNSKNKNLRTENNAEKQQQQQQQQQQQNNDKHLSPQLTNYIKGVINNLKNQHGLKTSSPNQLYNEIVYSLMNKSHQFIGIEDNIHKINIIAKLLRENRWRTPKGFFKYSLLTDLNKQKKTVNNTLSKKIKEQNTNISYVNNENNLQKIKINNIQQSIQEIERFIYTEKCYYNDLKQQYGKKPTQITQAAMLSINRKISALMSEKILLQEKLNIANVA